MSRQKSSFWLLVCVAAVIGLPSIVPAQQEGEIVQLAIETNLTILPNQDLAIVTGRSAEQSALQCAPGFEFQHNMVIVDPGGGRAAQRSQVVIFRAQEEPSKNGTRIQIISDGAACNADYKLYTGRVE